MSIYTWEAAAHEDYRPVSASEDWLPCRNCSERPRVWHFNYGNFARCCCRHRWEGSPVGVESSGDVYRRDENLDAYDRDALRVAWNEHCAAARPDSPTPNTEEAL